MNTSFHSHTMLRFSLCLVVTALLSHGAVKAGQSIPARQTAPPQVGTVQSRSTTPRPPTAAQTAPVQTQTPATPLESVRGQTETVPAARVETVDYGNFKLGGTVFSTGTEDVIVRILDSTLVRTLPLGHRQVDLSPFNAGVYLLSPGPARFIGSNKQAGNTINLGTLPAGELIFGLSVPEYNSYFQTGDASRNLDKLDHVIFRTFKSGPMELWFEDALGPKGTGRSDRDFNDLVLSVSGGVDNGTVAGLLQAIQLQTGEGRNTAIALLKKVNPKAAANLVAQSNPPAK